MPTNNYFIDLHCHSTLKPYGHVQENPMANNPKSKSSIWYYDSPKMIDKLIDLLVKVSVYSQSNFSAASLGNVSVVNIAIHALEVQFFINKLGPGKLPTTLENYITGFGVSRIKEIESVGYNYFDDIIGQYNYLKAFSNQEIIINDRKHRYVLVKSYAELLNEQSSTPADETKIIVVLNIEGGHCLGCGKDPIRHPSDKSTLLNNINTLKSWAHRPLFITLAHHYYNELAGHARSLPESINKLAPQDYGINTGFTETGISILEALLDNSFGKRIFIDVKHLSVESRKYYYNLLDTSYSSENIPIIYSHGGVNGLKTFSDAGNTDENSKFNQGDLNLFDEEIVRIAQSKGIIGLNLDQRVMASKKAINKISRKIISYRYHWCGLIWNNIVHIAETLDKAGLNAWDNICLGTDFDGVIDPINGFWSEEQIPLFMDLIKKHASKYIEHCSLSSLNILDPELIIQKISRDNIKRFYHDYFV